MRISEIGGEFALIERLLTAESPPGVVLPNGDDAAVFEAGGVLVAVSTDSYCEERHFTFQYFSPEQVGAKAIEAAGSDIVAVGGTPRFFLLALAIPSELPVETIERVQRGAASASKQLNAAILGGNIVSGTEKLAITVTAIGFVPGADHLCPRSAARPGDLLYVSGPLGGSQAGLRLLQQDVPGFEAVKKFHLEPHCRCDVISAIAPNANAMIDVSDGLANELHHICRASGCGCLVERGRIPILKDVRLAAAACGDDACDYALYGGEDFQLLYSVAPERRDTAIGCRIGCVTEERGLYIEDQGRRLALPFGGWDHFRGKA